MFRVLSNTNNFLKDLSAQEISPKQVLPLRVWFMAMKGYVEINKNKTK